MTQLDDSQILELLRETDLLRPASEAQRADLIRTARQLHLKSGEIIYTPGSTGTSFYLVVSGRVKLTCPDRLGMDPLLSMKEAGDFFGEMGLAESLARTAHSSADRVSHVLEFDRRDLLFLLRRNPDCAMAFAHMLATSLQLAAENLEILGRYDAPKRIWLKLMSLGQRYGARNPKTGQLEISHGFSQQNLADSIGLTRVMVNRQLSLWRKAGWVETDRGMIRILDPDALENAVWGDSLMG